MLKCLALKIETRPLLRAYLLKPLTYISIISFVLLLLEWRMMAKSGRTGTDFSIYYHSIQRYQVDHHSLYALNDTGFDQYLYPPPSIGIFQILSLLSEHAAYVVFIITSYACLVIGVLLWRRYNEHEDSNISFPEAAMFIVVCMASGMMYHNITLGQVNVLVLLLSILYLTLYHRYPYWAGFFLALAIWIKMYPAILLLVAILSKQGRKSIVACILSGIFIMGVSLLWIPLEVYGAFVEKMKSFSSYSSMHMINQSFISFILRWIHPFANAFKWPNIYEIPLWVKMANYILIVVIVAVGFYTAIKNHFNEKSLTAFGAILLSLIGVSSPLGWGHTYIFTLPLIYIAYIYYVQRGGLMFNVLFVFFALLYLVPVYNDKLFRGHWPLLISNFYYSKLLWLTITLIASIYLSLLPKKVKDLSHQLSVKQA
jgi:hypothetical protein